MDNKKKLIIGLLVLSVGLATAASEYECLDYYNSAQTYLKSNDYQNALRSIDRCRECYLQMGISSGVSRSDEVIRIINSTLSRKQMADAYYNIAGDYYLLGGRTVENMQRVSRLAANAKSIYSEINDNNGVVKSDDLVKSADQAVESIKSSKLEEATMFYRMANEKYIAGSYLESKTYALNASQLYSSIPDPEGIEKTATLLSAIEDKIRDIRINAAAAYDKALQLYAKATTTNDRDKGLEAINFARESQSLYQEINDREGIEKNMNLISNINAWLDTDVEAKLREARKLYLDAQQFYIIKDCQNATNRASRAKALYMELYNEAGKIEKDLPKDQRTRANLYESYIAEVNKLLEKIKASCTRDVMLQQAENLYKQAQESYLKNKVEDAISNARTAKNLYKDLENYVGESKCDSLIDQINDKITKIQTAELFMRKAREYYIAADFDNARYHATQAKSIYDKMNYDEKSKDAQSYLNKIEDAIKIKEAANREFNTARTFLENRNYAPALEKAKSAKNLYAQINYGLGVNESNRVIFEAQTKYDEEELKKRNTILAGALIVVVVGFAAFSWLRSRRKFETEVQERKVIDAQRIKKKEEELTLRSQDEIKEKVEDELRRLIERERAAGEDDTEGKNA